MILYSKYLGMEDDIEKFTMLIMKSDERDSTKGIELPN